MSDVLLGIIVTVACFILIALYVLIGAGGFGNKTDIIPFPDAKLTKRQRRSALKRRAKERRWNKVFSIGKSVGEKTGKINDGGRSFGSISSAKSFKSSGSSRSSAKMGKR